MATILETILTGITTILGVEVIVFLLFTFSFLAYLFSRGLGITALIVTFIVSAYLLSSVAINNTLFLAYDYFILIIMLFGLFIGLLVYSYFIK